MDERMTLEKLRDWHKRESKRGTGTDPWFHDDFHNSAAILLDAHLTQPSQAVDVTFDMVRDAEHFCPTDLPHLDRLRWKARKLTELLKASRAIGNAQAEGWRELDAEARRLYNASVGDAHNLHCLAWSELSKDQQRKWISKAAPTQATPNAHE